ncbi:MAG: aminotransferase class III-fold pyridoxal phosphate-dependent enzyme, partial [Chloroflexi bacterium]|nr:aminotransferase class III-fold pyridoxal phosphate-dependent enzyme [Chloroflexota bacterium]
AVMLSRTFTGRDLVLKVGGGWHGSQPWGLKGVHFGHEGFQEMETEGLPAAFGREVLVTRYNDVAALEAAFQQHGERIACFIVEPYIGAGGGIPAQAAYLRRARELTQQHGALLIFDEVIAGFRFCAHNLGSLYSLKPDLMTMGKVIGGGMPVAAVAGRGDVLALAGKAGGRKVRFDGGTYSAHPLSMLAGLTMLRHLTAREGEIYPRLGALGEKWRAGATQAFADEGVLARCTGGPNEVMPYGSSMGLLHFLLRPDVPMHSPDAVNDPACCDVEMRERVVKLAFLLEGVFVADGGGAVSMAHTDDDVQRMIAAARAVARRLAAAGFAQA